MSDDTLDFYSEPHSDDVQRLVSMKWLIILGISIIIGSVIVAYSDEAQKLGDVTITVPEFPTLPEFSESESDPKPATESISIPDSRNLDELSKSEKIQLIIDYTRIYDKYEWQHQGYDRDTMKKLEGIKEQIDTEYTCGMMFDTFFSSPKWTLRGYLAHEFVERCL